MSRETTFLLSGAGASDLIGEMIHVPHERWTAVGVVQDDQTLHLGGTTLDELNAVLADKGVIASIVSEHEAGFGSAHDDNPAGTVASAEEGGEA